MLAGLGTSVAALSGGAPAWADDYPSWSDVQEAKNNEGAASTKVSQISGLITRLEAQLEQAQADSARRGRELELAQDSYADAAIKADQITARASAAQAESDAWSQRAGQIAAQLNRTGAGDVTARLFAGKKDLLAELGAMSKLTQTSSEILQRARQARNVALTLSAQAGAAKVERARLKDKADAALATAVAAEQQSERELSSGQAQLEILRAQLAALTDTTAKTVSGYEAGVAERARLAEIARQAAAAAAAREAAAGGSSSSAAAGSSGWVSPNGGWISDGFGPRPAPCSGCSSYHRGIDISASCDAPIRAASAGTVIYAGPQGSYGNFVLLSHGSNVSTGYAHIRPGGIGVRIGQRVSAGQVIARVGTTGASTGCHLHFEVRVGGNPINGIPFMKQRGAPLG